MKKIGLIINPIAGMGGKVGLKGTDGPEALAEAKKLGARPEASFKVKAALEKLLPLQKQLQIFAACGEMGEFAAVETGFKPFLVGDEKGMPSAAASEEAARLMVAKPVDLLLFAGGDGTARNIYNALGPDCDIPVIGIPAGVKIHSAVYAISPKSAGELARRFIQTPSFPLTRAEVMDIDEEAFRSGRLSARLYGYLIVPCAGQLMQHLKVGGAEAEEAILEGIAERVVEMMKPGTAYIIGPGSTTVPIMEKMGLKGTLLGVDVVLDRKLLARDVSEKQLLKIAETNPIFIVVTVIGGQGYLFGRGNQQISAEVIKNAGRDNIIIVATKEKISALEGGSLLADTGNDAVNALLKGYYRIITAYREELIFPLSV